MFLYLSEAKGVPGRRSSNLEILAPCGPGRNGSGRVGEWRATLRGSG
jgi:hypothetical protein